MRVIDRRTVFLEQGEVVPVFCTCGHVYQPKPDSQKSVCPKCFKQNDHNEYGVIAEMRH